MTARVQSKIGKNMNKKFNNYSNEAALEIGKEFHTISKEMLLLYFFPAPYF